MARVLGLGGVFFKVADPEALGAWYRRWLDVPVQVPYGASFLPMGMPPGGYQIWSPFAADTDYFAPSGSDFMFNLVVDDLEGCLARVAEGGAEILPDRQDGDYGRFGWFLDPAGHKVELWQPPAVLPSDVAPEGS
ncbi:MAG: VOC family protein [bacterium]|nr:VOC family protein [bacterium]